MTPLVLAALLAGTPIAVPAAAAAQVTQPAAPAASAVAEAYRQFLRARRLEDEGDTRAAVEAYERAVAADPSAAEISAALADLRMRQDQAPEAIAAANEALQADPDNREAHRVLGTIYASAATAEAPRSAAARRTQEETLNRALTHLESATARAAGELQAEANLRAMLARVYMVAGRFADAVPWLAELVRQEPGWEDGANLLVEAYAGAGRSDEAVRWLEEAVVENPRLYATLADFYGRARRWSDAAAAYEQALRAAPRSFDLRSRYGSMLLNAGGRANAQRARDVLREALTMRGTDERALLLLSQAERQAGEYAAAEVTARRLINQNPANPRGFGALAEALSERGAYQDVVAALAPAVVTFRSGSDAGFPLALLLPQLGFAYQQLGRHAEAVAAFEEVHALSPQDIALTGYLVQAHLAAKGVDRAVAVARAARIGRPDDVRLARLEAQALNAGNRTSEALAVFDDLLSRRADDPRVHMALASVYLEANRGPQAIKVLQDAQTRFPADPDIIFELGAVLERQQQFADAEAAFRRAIALEPEHARALNYLGYMFAERGVRLDESVELIRRALALEPDNGSYLDSLGWAYFKDGQLGLAEEYLRRAAEQMLSNSVVQDHFGDVLFSLQRFQDAIDAWRLALSGDGDAIDTTAIDRKIRSAQQQLAPR